MSYSDGASRVFSLKRHNKLFGFYLEDCMTQQPQERRLCPGKVIGFALYLEESLAPLRARMQEYRPSLNALVT